jgi:hypothetical protein
MVVVVVVVVVVVLMVLMVLVVLVLLLLLLMMMMMTDTARLTISHFWSVLCYCQYNTCKQSNTTKIQNCNPMSNATRPAGAHSP